jgi:hypothetical protein
MGKGCAGFRGLALEDLRWARDLRILLGSASARSQTVKSSLYSALELVGVQSTFQKVILI